MPTNRKLIRRSHRKTVTSIQMMELWSAPTITVRASKVTSTDATRGFVFGTR